MLRGIIAKGEKRHEGDRSFSAQFLERFSEFQRPGRKKGGVGDGESGRQGTPLSAG
jgi:hypothetical protein